MAVTLTAENGWHWLRTGEIFLKPTAIRISAPYGKMLVADDCSHRLSSQNAGLKTAGNKHPLGVDSGSHTLRTSPGLVTYKAYQNPLYVDNGAHTLDSGIAAFVVVTLGGPEINSTHAHTASAPTAYPSTIIRIADRLVRHHHYGGAIPYQAWPKHPTSLGADWTKDGTIGSHQETLGNGLYVRQVVRLSSGLLLASAEDDINRAIVYSSADHGTTWTEIGTVIGTEVNCRRLADVGAGAVLAAADTAVYRSANSGTTFASVVSDGSVSAQVAVDLATGYALATLNDPSKVYFSDDGGATWTHITTLGDYIFTLAHLRRGTFIACGELGHIFRTTNYGYTWVDVGAVSEEIEFAAHDDEGRVVAISNYGDGVEIVYSVDYGENWSIGITVPAGTASGLAYVGTEGTSGKFILAYTNAGLVYARSVYFKAGESTLSSDSAVVISAIPDQPTGGTAEEGTIVNIFIDLVTEALIVRYSEDGGLSWSDASLPDSYTDNYSPKLCAGGPPFLIINVDSSTLKGLLSTNGKTWVETAHPILNAITYGGGKFVAITHGAGVTWAGTSISTDGATWDAYPTSLPTTGRWTKIAYGGGVYVALKAYSTGCAYSTDGISWSASVMPSSQNWQNLSYAGGLFFVTRASGTAYWTSIDGATWTERAFPTYGWLATRVAYGNGVYVAMDYYEAMVSVTGTGGWTVYDLAATIDDLDYEEIYIDLIFAEDRFIARTCSDYDVDKSSTLQSADGITWTYVSHAATYYTGVGYPSLGYSVAGDVETAYIGGAVFHPIEAAEARVFIVPVGGDDNATQISYSPTNLIEIWQSASVASTIDSTHSHTIWPYPGLISGPFIPDEFVEVTLPSFTVAAQCGAIATATLPSFTGEVEFPDVTYGQIAARLPRFSATAAGAGFIEADLPSFTVGASISVANPMDIIFTLPSMTVAATGAQASRATIAADLPSLRAAVAGSVQSTAAIAASLPAFVIETLAATGHPATIAATLPSWDADVTGYADMDATIAGTLPSLTAAIMARQISYTGQSYCPLSYSR